MKVFFKTEKYSKNFLLIASLMTLAIWQLSCANLRKPVDNKQGTKKTNAVAAQEIEEQPIITAIASQYLLKDSTSAKVYLEVSIENFDFSKGFVGFKEAFRANWLIQSDYTVRDRLAYEKIEITEANYWQKDQKILIAFDVERPKKLNEVLLLIEFWDINASKKAANDLIIDFTGKRLSSRFDIFESDFSVPKFNRFFCVNDSFEVKSVTGTAKDLFALQYEPSFEPAPSPMSTTAKGYSFGYSPKKVFNIKTNTNIQLPEQGLYLFVEDTTDLTNGFSLLISDERFPKYTRAEKLVQPVVYMSTKQEITAIREAADAKDALDKYFLEVTGGNIPLAKKIIKSYYKRVEEANNLFTNYKEGWKTDKGMVFIILGPPNKVQRNRNREVWVYSQSQNFSEVLFTFYKKPNQFTDNNYELVRYPEYQSYWYPFVEAWRTGNIAAE